MLKIAIDAMGGDFGPAPIVAGVLEALACEDFHALLVGKPEEIKPLIKNTKSQNISIIEANDVFSMTEHASTALKKKETSIYKAIDLVREGAADGVVSAGHSGATMGLATLRIGRLQNVSRPAIATLMPTCKNKHTLVLDVGANVDCKPENLLQFAIMGDAYAKNALKIDNPKIGLLSNGEEESKGNETTKAAFKLLQNLPNFVGNVEGGDVFSGEIDVVVCDGFIGNIMLKTSEGVAESISKIIKQHAKKSPIAIAGSILMKKVFKTLKKQIDYAEYGGAPLIGVDGCVIISHGKSNSKAIKNAIFQAINTLNSNTNHDIESKLKQYN